MESEVTGFLLVISWVVGGSFWTYLSGTFLHIAGLLKDSFVKEGATYTAYTEKKSEQTCSHFERTFAKKKKDVFSILEIIS